MKWEDLLHPATNAKLYHSCYILSSVMRLLFLPNSATLPSPQSASRTAYSAVPALANQLQHVRRASGVLTSGETEFIQICLENRLAVVSSYSTGQAPHQHISSQVSSPLPIPCLSPSSASAGTIEAISKAT
jgi:hypothetical protein